MRGAPGPSIGRLLTALLLFLLILAPAAGAQDAQARRLLQEKRLVIAADNLFPRTHGSLIITQPQATLFRLTQGVIGRMHGELIACSLCSQLPNALDGSLVTLQDEEGRTVTRASFELLPNLRWGDGTPLDIGDIEFGLTVARRYPPQVLDPTGITARIRSLRMSGPRRLEVLYEGSLCKEQLFVPPPLPRRLEEPIFRADPNRYLQRSLYFTERNRPGLYLGPYMIESEKAPHSIQLRRNPYYAGTTPYFERVDLLFSDPESAEKGLLDGSIDVLLPKAVREEALVRFTRERRDRFKILWSPSTTLTWLTPNFSRPALADRQVREALYLALDRDAMVKTLTLGTSLVAPGYLHPGLPAYMAGFPRYGYNVTRAATLLDGAGWRRDKSGQRRNAEGQLLALTLSYRAGDHGVGLALADAWRAIGVTVSLKEEPDIVSAFRGRGFDMVLSSITYSAVSPSMPQFFLSNAVPTAENGMRGLNFTGHADPALDNAIEAIDLAGCTRDDQRQAWTAFQQQLMNELPRLPLWFNSLGTVFTNRLEGVGNPPFGDPVLTIQRWRPKATMPP
ncbi:MULTISPECIES: ABC transporter substrate-binding protein [unclassified Azospirillum]|uniref:ABC transporter substrate-binding protein n=1 Tax=unclassified Azospirillum TaxID=2630922 RepID=UPI000B669C9C|nr:MULTISPECIES: ABC transporter substrate-binding protein [unclassified Azospirillum]SNT12074.1 peptide/nickel transport system substrate-binding protein [Azospirillum sp. RU38E]SNT26130.1 peptide/nickel transport system substrate-binding protein [Azospirillum sp. RU37A]